MVQLEQLLSYGPILSEFQRYFHLSEWILCRNISTSFLHAVDSSFAKLKRIDIRALQNPDITPLELKARNKIIRWLAVKCPNLEEISGSSPLTADLLLLFPKLKSAKINIVNPDVSKAENRLSYQRFFQTANRLEDLEIFGGVVQLSFRDFFAPSSLSEGAFLMPNLRRIDMTELFWKRNESGGCFRVSHLPFNASHIERLAFSDFFRCESNEMEELLAETISLQSFKMILPKDLPIHRKTCFYSLLSLEFLTELEVSNAPFFERPFVSDFLTYLHKHSAKPTLNCLKIGVPLSSNIRIQVFLGISEISTLKTLELVEDDRSGTVRDSPSYLSEFKYDLLTTIVTLVIRPFGHCSFKSGDMPPKLKSLHLIPAASKYQDFDILIDFPLEDLKLDASNHRNFMVFTRKYGIFPSSCKRLTLIGHKECFTYLIADLWSHLTSLEELELGDLICDWNFVEELKKSIPGLLKINLSPSFSKTQPQHNV